MTIVQRIGMLFVVFCLIAGLTPSGASAQDVRGDILSLFPPQVARPGGRVELQALVRNTGATAWPSRVQVEFQIIYNAKAIWTGGIRTRGLEAGESEWYSTTATIPEAAKPGLYRYRANLVRGNEVISTGPGALRFWVDDFAFKDGFERDVIIPQQAAPGEDTWSEVEVGDRNKLGLVSTAAYTGDQSLRFQLKNSEPCRLIYRFEQKKPTQLEVYFRFSVDKKLSRSKQPLILCSLYDDQDLELATVYYNPDWALVLMDCRGKNGVYRYGVGGTTFLAVPGRWYPILIRASFKPGASFSVSVDGMAAPEVDTDAGQAISRLALGSPAFGGEPAKGRCYVDNVCWATETPDGFDRGRVALTFDNGALNNFDLARPILNEYGIKGSFNVVTKWTEDEIWVMQPADLRTLQAEGHLIGSQGHTFQDLTTLTDEEIVFELQNAAEKLKTWGLDVRCLALPFGRYDENVIARASQFYDKVLTTEEGVNGRAGVLEGTRIFRVAAAEHTFDELRKLILDAEADKTWLVLYFNSIGDGDPPYWMSEEDFRAIVLFIVRRDVDVVPIEFAP